VLTEPLSSNENEINIQTHRLMVMIMKYAVEMGSDAVIYIPSFIKTGSGIQKWMGSIHRNTDSMVIS
jgi:hypothetical protein